MIEKVIILKEKEDSYFMIKKKYRLKQREVKKVLNKSKPFFSYGIVLNFKSNHISFNRFSIIIWAKSVTNNVSRNFFRRKFYHFISASPIFSSKTNKNIGYDFVFVVKKQTKLDKKNKETIVLFEKDLSFLEKKLENN